jgi:ADP-ribosylglycohydrolase
MMLGHAIGDAAGAPVEFMTRRQIMDRFGPDGVVGLEPWETDEANFTRGSFTDDTQMMLATGLALLDAALVWRRTGILDVADSAHLRYLEWLETQTDLRHRRGPGATCLAALESGESGSIDDSINGSKGSGGIMRVTPMGIALEPERALEAAAEVAAVTHGHPTGYLCAGAFADILSRGLNFRPDETELLQMQKQYRYYSKDDTDTVIFTGDEENMLDTLPEDGARLIGEICNEELARLDASEFNLYPSV